MGSVWALTKPEATAKDKPSERRDSLRCVVCMMVFDLVGLYDEQFLLYAVGQAHTAIDDFCQ